MKRISRGLVAVFVGAALTLIGGFPHPAGADSCGREPSAATGSFTCAWYPAQGAPGAREFWVYVPAQPRAKMPVVVYLHGCTQTAVIAAAETRFDLLADRQKFIVVYPQQSVTANSSAPLADGNGIGCW